MSILISFCSQSHYTVPNEVGLYVSDKIGKI